MTKNTMPTLGFPDIYVGVLLHETSCMKTLISSNCHNQTKLCHIKNVWSLFCDHKFSGKIDYMQFAQPEPMEM